MLSRVLTLLVFAVCVLGAAIPTEHNSLAIRSEGTIVVHEDAAQLIKRVDATLLATVLTALAGVTYTVCNAPIVPAVAATACVVAAAGTFLTAMFGLWKGSSKRDLSDGMLYTIGDIEYKTHYAGLPGGPSVLSQLKADYNGTEILVTHQTCERHDCFESYYSHHFNEKNEIVQKLSARSRKLRLAKRQEDNDESGSATDSSNDLMYVDYIFQNMNTADETAEANDSNFGTEFLQLMGAETSYTSQGYKCLTVLDADDGNAVGAQGYITISQDYQMADPDNEAKYISMCA